MKSLSDDIIAAEPEIAWRQIARMRDHLAHRYFMTEVQIIQDTIDGDLHPLMAAVERMRDRIPPSGDGVAAEQSRG